MTSPLRPSIQDAAVRAAGPLGHWLRTAHRRMFRGRRQDRYPALPLGPWRSRDECPSPPLAERMSPVSHPIGDLETRPVPSHRGTRVRPAWNGERAPRHARRAATEFPDLVRAPSRGLARCATPATIRRATDARQSHRSRWGARSQPDACATREQMRAVRRSTTVCRGTPPCLRARVEGRVWRRYRQRSSHRPRATCVASRATRSRASEPTPVSRSERRDGLREGRSWSRALAKTCSYLTQPCR